MPNSTKQNDAAGDSLSLAELPAKGFPAPDRGFVITHLLIVADQDRSRQFYSDVLGGEIIRERDPAVVRLNNSWVIINSGGGPTDDKQDVIAAPPQSSHVLTSALNIRVADVWATYREWRSRGAEFLTEPKDHGGEIRCYIRDPDGHLIEVGQSTGILNKRYSTDVMKSAVQSENERNKAVVDEYFKAGVQGHLTSFAAYLHPDFTVTAPNYLPWGGRHVGAAFFRDQVLPRVTDVFDFARFSYDNVVAEDGHVVAVFNIGVTGTDAIIKIVDHWTVRDGKAISLLVAYFEPQAVLEKLGIEHCLGR